MGESTKQIEREISAERNELSRNFSELETRAKTVTDWRSYFEKHPMTMIGVAFGGGILLAALAGSGGRSRSQTSPADGHDGSPLGIPGQVSDTWEHIKGALVGVASGKAVEFLNEAVPGFQEHFDKHRLG